MIPSNKERKNNEEVYSTEEVRIGKWIDGKPLYRKVVKAQVPATSTNGTVASSTVTVGENISECFLEFAYISAGENYPLPYIHSAINTYVKLFVKSSGIVTIHNSIANWKTNIITMSILYTKTTDIVTLYQRGDINMDGVIDQSDYDLLNNYLTTGSGLSEEQKILADVDGDGRIRTTDLDALQNLINNA